MLASALARETADEFRCVFACLDDLGSLGEQLLADGYCVKVLGRRPGLDVKCARNLATFLREQQVQLVHAHQYTPFFYSVFPSLLGRPRVLFTEHGRWFPDVRSARRVAYNRLVLGSRDTVVAVGNSVRDALVQNEGISAKRVQVIYNGVDLERFSRPIATAHKMRHELCLAGSDFVFLQVARLDSLKDHPTSVRAVAQISEIHPNVRLLLVGEGPERPLIEQVIRENNVEQHVRLLGQRSDIAEILEIANVFLLSSLSEGIPVTIIEAMGMELPIVATNVGGLAEVVDDGVTGLLSPAGDYRALAASMDQLIRDPELRRRMGKAGRNRAETLFSARTMIDAYRSLYHNMTVRGSA